jgi:hypothetical protein
LAFFAAWAGFFQGKKPAFTTFGFSAAGPQSCNIFAVRFLVKKLRRATNTIYRQLLIEN